MPRPWCRGLLVWAALVGGCNLTVSDPPAAELDEAGAPMYREVAEVAGSSVELRFYSGIPMWQAAGRVPGALERLSSAARLLLGNAGLSSAATALPGELLHAGMLLPLPAGVLEVRTLRPPATRLAPAPLSDEPSAPASAEESDASVPPELVGVYIADGRLLILQADGRFSWQPESSSKHRAAAVGPFARVHKNLQLQRDDSPAVTLTPLGNDGWRDTNGATYWPLHPRP